MYVLGLFFLADLVRHLASVVPVLEQQIFLLEMLAGTAVLTWWIWRWRRAPPASRAATGFARVLRLAAVPVLVVFAVALVAGAAGYMRLALLLGAGVVGNGYLAVVLYAGARVVDCLVAFALREAPLRHLAMVRRHRALLERRAHGLLRAFAIGAWAFFALRYFGLWTGAVTMTAAALAATLKRGTLSISLGDVLAFAITVGAAFILSALLRFLLAEEVYPRLRLGRGLPEVLSGVLHYGLLLASFLLGLAALGVDLTKITILAGAFGVGIGFGLQNIVNNVVSGSIVLFERKINVGDAVQIRDVAGRVQQLGMRACTVRTWEGAEVIVPNASLTSEQVVNWTLSDRHRRIDVAVGVAYGTAPEKVLDILLGVARAHPRVLTDPAPAALFRGFGDSALKFEMQVWTDRFDLWVKTQSELSLALYAALREAGIEIPFPQREVRLHEA
jgi:small-conductance mechanosensitive channel